MTTATRRTCPICGNPRATSFTPFCSARCRDRDLLQWLADGYALPGPAVDEETGTHQDDGGGD